MDVKHPHALRLELARGHLELGDLDLAIQCLERLDDDAPRSGALAGLVGHLVATCEIEPGAPLAHARALRARLFGEATRAAPSIEEPAPVAKREPAATVIAASPVPTQAPKPVAGTSRSRTHDREIEALQAWLAQVQRRFGLERAHDVP